MKKSARAKAPKSQKEKFAVLTMELSDKAREGLTSWPQLLEIPLDTAFKIYANIVHHLATDVATVPDHWMTSWSQPDRQSAERVAGKYFKAFPHVASVTLPISGEPFDTEETFTNPAHAPSAEVKNTTTESAVRFTPAELGNICELLASALDSNLMLSPGNDATPAEILTAWKAQRDGFVDEQLRCEVGTPRRFRHSRRAFEDLRDQFDGDAATLERLLPLLPAK